MIKKISYFAVITSLISASFISVNIGFMQLSVFRAIIIILALVIFIKSIKTPDSIIVIDNKQNRLSIQIMITWFCYAILSVIWVKDYSMWFKNVYFLGLCVICIIIFSNVFKNSNDILTCFRIIAIMIIIHNFIGWSEVITGNYLFLDNSLEYAKMGYPVSMFGNTNDFATFLMMSVFFLYICIANTKYLIIKTGYIITLISSILLLLLTNSRANIIGLILAIAVFLILLLKNKKMQIIMFLTALVFCTVALLNIDLIIKTVNVLFDRINLNSGDTSLIIRANLIKNGAYFLTQTFWFGTGAGNIEYWMGHYGVFNTLGIVNMHNWWMEILTGYGVIIFALYLTFYITLIKSFYKRYKTSENKIDSTLTIALICCLIGYIIGGISSSSNMDNEWLWVFWAISIAYQGIGYRIKHNILNENCN